MTIVTCKLYKAIGIIHFAMSSTNSILDPERMSQKRPSNNVEDLAVQTEKDTLQVKIMRHASKKIRSRYSSSAPCSPSASELTSSRRTIKHIPNFAGINDISRCVLQRTSQSLGTLDQAQFISSDHRGDPISEASTAVPRATRSLKHISIFNRKLYDTHTPHAQAFRSEDQTGTNLLEPKQSAKQSYHKSALDLFIGEKLTDKTKEAAEFQHKKHLYRFNPLQSLEEARVLSDSVSLAKLQDQWLDELNTLGEINTESYPQTNTSLFRDNSLEGGGILTQPQMPGRLNFNVEEWDWTIHGRQNVNPNEYKPRSVSSRDLCKDVFDWKPFEHPPDAGTSSDGDSNGN